MIALTEADTCRECVLLNPYGSGWHGGRTHDQITERNTLTEGWTDTLGEQRWVVQCLDGLQAKVDPLKSLQEETSRELAVNP